MSWDFSHIRAEMFQELPENIKKAILERVEERAAMYSRGGFPEWRVRQWREDLKLRMVNEAHRTMKFLAESQRGECAEGGYI